MSGRGGERKEMTMTEAQFETTWKLASQFGHEWARWTKPADGILDPHEIAIRTQEHSPYLGIHAPSLAGWQVVEHTTGTGRLKWAIFTNGGFVLTIHRPQDGEVLRYESAAGPKLTISSLARERHAAALTEALMALDQPIPKELQDIRDIGGGEALRRLARLELIPTATSSALEDVWSRHHERQLERERYSTMYPEDITTATPEAVPMPVGEDYVEFFDPTEGLLVDEDLPSVLRRDPGAL